MTDIFQFFSNLSLKVERYYFFCFNREILLKFTTRAIIITPKLTKVINKIVFDVVQVLLRLSIIPGINVKFNFDIQSCPDNTTVPSFKAKILNIESDLESTDWIHKIEPSGSNQ